MLSTVAILLQSIDMTEQVAIVWAASIAAIPATLAASAAWFTARSTNRKVSTSNGQSAGQMVEATYTIAKGNGFRLDEMSKALERHIYDQDAHCQEQKRILDTLGQPVTHGDHSYVRVP